MAVYMNPGGGKPAFPINFNDDVPDISSGNEIISKARWFPAIPDITQTQTILMMDMLGCSVAHVLNITDICSGRSEEVNSLLSGLEAEGDAWDSIFHRDWRREIANLPESPDELIVIGGWGGHSKKNSRALYDRSSIAASSLPNPKGSPGYKDKIKFRHPRPMPRGITHTELYASWRVGIMKSLARPDLKELASYHRSVDFRRNQDEIWMTHADGKLSVDLRLATI